MPADALKVHLSLDAVEEPGWRSTLISFLYRRFTGERPRSIDTETVWELMEARASSILVGELFRLLSETVIPDAHADVEYHKQDLLAELDEWFDYYRSVYPEFYIFAAERMFGELPNLLWAQLTQSLASKGNCELEGFGRFVKEYRTNQLEISFDAESVVSQLMMPEMEFNDAGLTSLSRMALELCVPATVPHLYDLATTEVSAGIDDASFFASTILENRLGLRGCHTSGIIERRYLGKSNGSKQSA
jgi:hypothetical protein